GYVEPACVGSVDQRRVSGLSGKHLAEDETTLRRLAVLARHDHEAHWGSIPEDRAFQAPENDQRARRVAPHRRRESRFSREVRTDREPRPRSLRQGLRIRPSGLLALLTMAPCHWFIFKAVSRCNLA